MKKYFRRGLFDRADGWRVRRAPALFFVIPYIMRTRMDSQNYVEESINLETLNDFIRQHKQEMPELSTMHIIMAALVRMLSQRPYLNRFVLWNKNYARNHINISLMIKRVLADDGEETLIKPEFEPEDTLSDVVAKVQAELEKNRPEGAKNGTDRIARLFSYFPAFLLRLGVRILRGLDNVGWLPGAILKASPFHCSAFLTNVASLRVKPIYHHLYEFGTCSLFAAIGKPERAIVSDPQGNPVSQRVMGARYVMDERVCDGHYYAASMRLFYNLLNNPERLLTPPDTVVVDDGIAKKRLDVA